MAHEQVGLQGFNFAEVIARVPTQLAFRGNIIANDAAFINSNMNVDRAALTPPPPPVIPPTPPLLTFEAYLDSKSKDNPYPGSWKGFLTDFFLQFNPDLPAGEIPTDPEDFQDKFGFVEFRRQMFKFNEAVTDPTFAAGTELKDWSLWDPSPAFTLDVGLFSDLTERALDHFLSNFSYVDSSGADILINQAEFYKQFYDFLTVTAVVQDATVIGGSNPDILSYEEIFNSFFTAGGEDNDGLTLGERFTVFIEKRIKDQGFFLPSLHVDEWYNELQNNFLLPLTGTELLTTTKSSEGLRRTNILNRIFQLLADMIQVLQQVAAAQARRLQFLTQFQTSYTALLNKIPVFVRGGDNIDAIDGVDNPPVGTDADLDEENTVRQDLNLLNSTLSDQIRGRRSVIQDRAKAIQSNVNQSNDAVSQQANIATSIIQQLTTLLNSIFR